MEVEQLAKANKLHKEIKELNSFINTASKVWTGKLESKGSIFKFISNSYGAIASEEFEMNTEIKNRVLDVLREYKAELEEEFKNIK